MIPTQLDLDPPVCQVCGYELTGIGESQRSVVQCPECGHYASLDDKRPLATMRKFLLSFFKPWAWAFPIGLLLSFPLGLILDASWGLLVIPSLIILAIPILAATYFSFRCTLRFLGEYRTVSTANFGVYMYLSWMVMWVIYITGVMTVWAFIMN